MLAKQPEDRFQDGMALARAIAAYEMARMARDTLTSAGFSSHDVPARDAGDGPLLGDADIQRHAVALDAHTPTPARLVDARRRMRCRERAEPNIGRLDEIVAAVSRGPVSAAIASALGASSAPPRRGPWLAIAVVALLAIGSAARHGYYQDRLRTLLPRTEFNDTLARAQRALDDGRLTGTRTARANCSRPRARRIPTTTSRARDSSTSAASFSIALTKR